MNSSYIQRLREKIGTQKTIIGYGVVITRGPDEKILLQRRTDFHTWGLPGGYTHLGENAAHTAVREIRGETGYDIEPVELLGVSSQARPWVYPNGDQVAALISLFRAKRRGAVTSGPR